MFDCIRLQRRINTLELELETLENTIKTELYKDFIAKLGESEEIERLKNENKRLKLQIRELKGGKNYVRKPTNNKNTQKDKETRKRH